MSERPIDAAAGLKSDEARRRLTANGPNSVLDVTLHPINRTWMLEAAILLQLALGEYFEAAAIG